jgi:hypothetical protein
VYVADAFNGVEEALLVDTTPSPKLNVTSPLPKILVPKNVFILIY